MHCEQNEALVLSGSFERARAKADKALVEGCPVYPLQLEEGAMTEDLTILYRSWQRRQGWAPLTESEPWVPVGCCGPVLVLGHYRPNEAGTPLPAWCFQPVRLSVLDYQRRLEELREGACLVEEREEGSGALRDRLVLFPERFIRPAGPRAALQFLLEYFPHKPAHEGLLRERLTQVIADCGRLPEGYEAAVDFVLGRGPIVDLRAVKLQDPTQLTCGHVHFEGLALVASQGKCLWVAPWRREAGLVVDRMLNELGDGWRVTTLRVAGGAVKGQAEVGGAQGPRERIVIENRIQARRLVGGEGFTPGEIVMSESLVTELEGYDPRRPDRDPVKVFLRELSAAIRCGASDLHVEPGVESARIRARVDGVMEEWLEMGVDFAQAVVGAAKELAGLPSERFLPQDGSCTIRHAGAVVGARVSSYPIRKRGQKLVLRLLPRRGQVPALREILPEWQARVVMRAASSPQGLILVCGPTGSGKTTTLFSVLAALNTPTRNIMTMEDPVEYELEGLNQAELDPQRGANWDSLLKGFLRQDPDAGLIGEVRDRETAEIAVRQALTGHVVFATLHTLSCARTLERLIDMGVNADMLASALTLVEGQRLVRKLCPRCRVVRRPGPAELEIFKRQGLAEPEQLWSATAQGCEHCRHGYKGRVAAVEVLPIVEGVVRLIEQRARSREFEEWMAAEGLPSVFQSALQLAADGASSLEEAMEWQSVWGDFEWRKPV